MPSTVAPTLTRRLLGSTIADALAGPHTVDHYLELLRPDWAVRDVRARVVRSHRPNPDALTLVLRPTTSWSGFRPGQHVELTVEIDGVRHRRCYSITGSADDRSQEIELTLRIHPQGKVSRYLAEHAGDGDLVIGIDGPLGEDFVLPEAAELPAHLLLISGGSGITPVLSMLRTLCARGHKGQITFLHYARGPEELLYADELAALEAAHDNVMVVRAYTRSPDASADLRGHLTAEHLDMVLAGQPDDLRAYACGPGDLVEAVREEWQRRELGAPLHVEHFAPPELDPVDPDQLGTLTLSASGLELDGDGRSILEQAEGAGLEPKHGCRMGICRTCVCTLEQGQVRSLLTGDVHGTPGEEIPICISAAVGDVRARL